MYGLLEDTDEWPDAQIANKYVRFKTYVNIDKPAGVFSLV